jgi:outer membrane protein assembly factor BamB
MPRGRSRRDLAMTIATLVLSIGSLLNAVGNTWAGDWPQILGPHRNGTADDERLADQWPQGGPPTVWQRDVGEGLAGVAAVRGIVVLFHRIGNEEIAEALDARSGKPVWKAAFPTQYASSIAEDNGPRCVPLIHKDAVYLFGAEGNLHCVSLDDGKKRWSRAAYEEYQAPEGYFGAGSTPIVEGNKLLVNVGGQKTEAGIVAFDLGTGKTVWKATEELASYSSPTAVTQDGVRHVLFVTRLSILSLDPDNGQVRFSLPFGSLGPTVNAATPLVIDGHLFASASYGIGAVLARFDRDSIETVWENDRVMSSQYSTCVYRQGCLYGVDGRQDQGSASLRAFDPMTGKIFWTEKGFGMATLILADDKLIIVKTDGNLVLAEPLPERFRPLATASVFSTTTRALPALADGQLYVRDTRTLKCLDLGRAGE